MAVSVRDVLPGPVTVTAADWPVGSPAMVTSRDPRVGTSVELSLHARLAHTSEIAASARARARARRWLNVAFDAL